jgi:hypothetical protein
MLRSRLVSVWSALAVVLTTGAPLVTTAAPNFLDMTRLQVLAVEEEDIPLSTGPAAVPVG